MMRGEYHDRYSASYHRDQKRFAAQANAVCFERSHEDMIRSRPVLMERAVHNVKDLKDLMFEGRSLYSVFNERGWTSILQLKGKVYSDFVYDFYKPLKDSSQLRGTLSAYVREVRVVITPTKIASFLNLPPLPKLQPNRPSSKEYSKQPVDEIHRALTGTEHDVNREVISLKELTPFFQMLNLIVTSNINPTNHTTDISIEQGRFLLDIALGVDIDLASHIFKTIRIAADSDSSEDGLPFGLLITGLSLDAGVEPQFGEKEDEPMGLIRLIKPISQTGPLACPSTQEAVGTASSTDQTLPPWFHVMLSEIGSRVAAEVAPIHRQLQGIDTRLKTVEEQVQDLYSIFYEDKISHHYI